MEVVATPDDAVGRILTTILKREIGLQAVAAWRDVELDALREGAARAVYFGRRLINVNASAFGIVGVPSPNAANTGETGVRSSVTRRRSEIVFAKTTPRLDKK